MKKSHFFWGGVILPVTADGWVGRWVDGRTSSGSGRSSSDGRNRGVVVAAFARRPHVGLLQTYHMGKHDRLATNAFSCC